MLGARYYRSAGVALVLLAIATAPAASQEAGLVVGSKFELFVHDSAASARFYGTLGFLIAHRKSNGYTTLRAGETVIALSQLPWWLPTHWLGFLRLPPMGTEIVLYTADLEGQQKSLDRAGYTPGEIARQEWGDRDFRVRDPDGYYVRVSEGAAVPAANEPLHD